MSFLSAGIVGGSDIPPTVIALYDARGLSLSDGDTVDPWGADKGPNLSATGSPSYNASSNIDSIPAVTYDGSNDYHTPNSSATATQPVVVYAVLDYDATFDGNTRTFVDGEGGNGEFVFQAGGAEWIMFAGKGPLRGSADTSSTLLTGVYDGSNSVLREDRSLTASGDVGTGDFDLEAVGVDLSNSGRKWDGDIVYAEIHDGRPSVGVQNREDEIVNDLGLSI